MMRQLLYKELKLALHPTAYMFVFFPAMLLIPNYPYYVAFFYVGMGVFFTCLGGRENNDIMFTLLLPVKKSDAVKARLTLISLLELASVALSAPFIFLRASMPIGGNEVGMDANASLLGSALIMFAAFNFCFFTYYYAHPDKVGTAFIRGAAAIFVYMTIAEILVHFPVISLCDGLDPAYLPLRLAILAAGMLIFAAVTYVTYKKCAANFEKIDL